ncbi:hypothetical protein [Streptomyces sp. NPDC051909]|uniref:hypothetical protein n=1 Tax=Streptomyces sp. NPDC051909 TaxID=3154944 RepID=UPI003430D51D
MSKYTIFAAAATGISSLSLFAPSAGAASAEPIEYSYVTVSYSIDPQRSLDAPAACQKYTTPYVKRVQVFYSNKGATGAVTVRQQPGRSRYIEEARVRISNPQANGRLQFKISIACSSEKPDKYDVEKALWDEQTVHPGQENTLSVTCPVDTPHLGTLWGEEFADITWSQYQIGEIEGSATAKNTSLSPRNAKLWAWCYPD